MSNLQARNNITQRRGGPSSDNFHLRAFKDTLTAAPSKKSDNNTCSVCAESAKVIPSVCTCLECSMRLCQSCKTIHQQRFRKVSHTLVDGVDFSVSSKCQVHNQVSAEFFCIHCQEPLCTICALEDRHNSHDIDDAISQMESICTKIIETLPDCKQYMKENDAIKEDLLKQLHEVNNVKTTIEETGQELKASIDEQVANLVQDLEKEFEKPIRNLLAKVEKREQNLRQMLGILDKINTRKISTDKFANLHNFLQTLLEKINTEGENISANEVNAPIFEKMNVNIGRLSISTNKKYKGSISIVARQEIIREELSLAILQPAQHVAVSSDGEMVQLYNDRINIYESHGPLSRSTELGTRMGKRVMSLFFKGKNLYVASDRCLWNVGIRSIKYLLNDKLVDIHIAADGAKWKLTDEKLQLLCGQTSDVVVVHEPTCIAADERDSAFAIAVADNNGKIIRLFEVLEKGRLKPFDSGQIDYTGICPGGFVQAMQFSESHQLFILDGQSRNINHITLDGKILNWNIILKAYGPALAFSYRKPYMLVGFKEKLVRFRYQDASA